MTVEAGGIRVLARELGGVPVELRAAMRPAIRAAAGIITADAKSRASYSTRIPGAISVGTSFSSRNGGVAIRVASVKAPHARVLEGTTKRATFRHPVFGSESTWVEQSTRPFLFPAVRAKRAEFETALRAVVRAVLQ